MTLTSLAKRKKKKNAESQIGASHPLWQAHISEVGATGGNLGLLRELWVRSGGKAARGLLAKIANPLPKDALAGAVATETNDPRKTKTIQRLHSLVQPSLAILTGVWRQGIEYPSRPAFLLERQKHRFLFGAGSRKRFTICPSTTNSRRIASHRGSNCAAATEESLVAPELSRAELASLRRKFIVSPPELERAVRRHRPLFGK